jgi:hypothetical protein
MLRGKEAKTEADREEHNEAQRAESSQLAHIQTVHSAAASAPPPKANIVFYLDADDNYFRVQVDHEKIFREVSQPTARSAVVVQFRNEPNPPQKVSRASNVRSSVFYYFGHSNTAEYRSDYACWLNEPASTVSFEVGMKHSLILGIFQPVGSEHNFQIYDRSEPNIPCVLSTGGSVMLNITVKLFWGKHYEFGIEEKFELVMETAGNDRYFELSHLTGEMDERHKPVRQSRGRARFK